MHTQSFYLWKTKHNFHEHLLPLSLPLVTAMMKRKSSKGTQFIWTCQTPVFQLPCLNFTQQQPKQEKKNASSSIIKNQCLVKCSICLQRSKGAKKHVGWWPDHCISFHYEISSQQSQTKKITGKIFELNTSIRGFFFFLDQYPFTFF